MPHAAADVRRAAADVRRCRRRRTKRAAIGLYYYRHRVYHAQLGRFVSRDPVGYEGSPSNLIRYVLNSPIIHTDPLGLQVVDYIPQHACKVIIFAGHIVPDYHESFDSLWVRFDMALVRHTDEHFKTIKKLHEQYPDGLPDSVAIGGVGCFAPQLLFWLDQWFPEQHVNPRDSAEGRLSWSEAPRRLGLTVQSAFSHAKEELCKTEQCKCGEVTIEVRCSSDMKAAIRRFGRETHKKLCDNSRRNWGPYKNVVKC